MEKMTIGEVANRVGLRTSAIRFYERVGLLPAPRRINGHRRYESDVFQKIRIIQIAQKMGLTVGEIRLLLHEFPADTPPSVRWQSLASQKLEEIKILEARIATMKGMLEQSLQCQCPTLDDCASEITNPEAQSDVQIACGNPITSGV